MEIPEYRELGFRYTLAVNGHYVYYPSWTDLFSINASLKLNKYTIVVQYQTGRSEHDHRSEDHVMATSVTKPTKVDAAECKFIKPLQVRLSITMTLERVI